MQFRNAPRKIARLLNIDLGKIRVVRGGEMQMPCENIKKKLVERQIISRTRENLKYVESSTEGDLWQFITQTVQAR